MALGASGWMVSWALEWMALGTLGWHQGQWDALQGQGQCSVPFQPWQGHAWLWLLPPVGCSGRGQACQRALLPVPRCPLLPGDRARVTDVTRPPPSQFPLSLEPSRQLQLLEPREEEGERARVGRHRGARDLRGFPAGLGVPRVVPGVCPCRWRRMLAAVLRKSRVLSAGAK